MFETEPRQLDHHRQLEPFFVGIEIRILNCQRSRIEALHRIDLLNGREGGLFLVTHDSPSFISCLTNTNVLRYCSQAGRNVVTTRPISFRYASGDAGWKPENRFR